MKVIGLTGSIGMGKSTAAKMLAEMGVPVHDADATVHELLAPGGAAVAPVAKLCPGALATSDKGEAYIDRKVLGPLFFENPGLKQQGEDILFPLVRQSSDDFVAEKKAAGCKLVALDIPLLFEVGRDKDVDVTICVTAPKEVQKARVMARGTSEERFEQVLAAQMPDAEKRKRATFVVETDKGLEDTRRQLKAIVDRFKNPPRPKICL
ncbi:MAG: dephospho-CoA kinase [Alphaproteobacteria bacterium]|nr:dephospho-CoA kinase [Alphaproteobacteria bacterium]